MTCTKFQRKYIGLYSIGTHEGKRLLEKPGRRWKDTVSYKKLVVNVWRGLNWLRMGFNMWAFVKTVLDLRVP